MLEPPCWPEKRNKKKMDGGDEWTWHSRRERADLATVGVFGNFGAIAVWQTRRRVEVP